MIKLFVSGFPLDMDELKLAEMIALHGDIKTIKLVRDKKTRVCKGYGFVEVADRETAEKIVLALNGQPLRDRQLTVNIREEEPAKPVYKKIEPGRVKRPRRIIPTITGLLVTFLLAC